MEKMDRVNKILNNPSFRQHLKTIDELECERIFCKHDIRHLIDVCRLAWIQVLSNQYSFHKDIIYAIGLLHDIGRGQQYKDGTPHAQAGELIARTILPECGYDCDEINTICNVVLFHQHDSDNLLQSIIYHADKASRLCSFCNAKSECNWSKINELIEL